MRVDDAIGRATVRLKAAGISQPLAEARSLTAFAIGRDRTFLFAHPEYELAARESEQFEHVISRREVREPFQYIVGKQEFYGLDFEVRPGVLIPRPETEILVAAAIEHLEPRASQAICEIGVGTGCISISVLAHLARATSVAGDIADVALELANVNAVRHGVADRLHLVRSDTYATIPSRAFDAILSNPPYIPATDMEDLQAEVRDFEPHAALTDGGSGLELVERIVRGAPDRLVGGGILLIEIGIGQAERVREMFGGEVWQSVEMLRDLQAIERTVLAVRR